MADEKDYLTMENDELENLPQTESQFFRHLIGQVEDNVGFQEATQEINAHMLTWSDAINKVFNRKTYKNRDLVSFLGLSEATLRRIRHGIPSRENLIKICALHGLSLDETNEILTKRAGYAKLYSKNADDLIWIHIINERLAEDKNTRAVFNTLYRECEEFVKIYSSPEKSKNTSGDTSYYDGLAKHCKTDEEFLSLYARIKTEVTTGYDKLLEEIDKVIAEIRELPNAVLGNNDTFLSRHYEEYRQLRDKHICPSREYIVFFAMRYGCSADRINHLLDLAGMAPLSVYDKLERAIYYRIEKFYAENDKLIPGKNGDVRINIDEYPDYFDDITMDIKKFVLEKMQLAEEPGMLSKGIINFLKKEYDVDQLFDEPTKTKKKGNNKAGVSDK